MKLMKTLKSVALVAMLFAASAANAGLYQFNLTGDYTASWQMDSAAKPDVYSSGEGIIFEDVDGNFPGSLFDLADLTFYNGDLGGGMQIKDWYADTLLLLSDGPQLYTGTEKAPTFKLGTFALTEFEGLGSYTLTVTDLDAVPGPVNVPEPATTAMLLGGLGLLYASRKRRQGN